VNFLISPALVLTDESVEVIRKSFHDLHETLRKFALHIGLSRGSTTSIASSVVEMLHVFLGDRIISLICAPFQISGPIVT